MSISDSDLKELSDYVVDRIKYIIEEFGPRPPGSVGENKAQDFMKKELESFGMDRVLVDEFKVAPKAFMGFMIVAAAIDLCAIVFYWFFPIIGFFLSLLAFFSFYFEFAIYKKFLDWAFPKKISKNVIGIKKVKSGNPARRLIINGHADASYEFRWNYKDPKLYLLFAIVGIVGSVIVLAISTVNAIFNYNWSSGYYSLWGFLGLILVGLSPFIIPVLFFYNYSVVAPGANDNLTGAFAAMAIAKYISEKNIELENTEIWFVITGSEEAGLRGAKDFAKKHAKELASIPTACIVIETLHDLKEMTIMETDLNGNVKLDPQVTRLLVNAAEKAGKKISVKKFPFGGGSSDAAAFQQGGIPSGFLESMGGPPLPRYYHTRLDNWDNLKKDAIEWGIKIVYQALMLYEENGLTK
ncbi:MAG: M20/M25/M40 family metallo-hydrolase [Promethearchaeota archaeon]